jgi:RNA polymerase sigma factor (sigma-70 family)
MVQSEGNTAQLQRLLDRAAEGSDDAHEELITKASQRLLKLTRKMLRGYPHLRRWEQTDDVFQTAVMRLHRSLADVKPDSVRHFFALAATQIRRTLIDLARHHFGPQGQAAKHQSNAGEAVSDGGGELQNKPDAGNPPETLESWAQFHEAVEQLPDDEREVFELVWYGGMAQKDIAALLDISEPTVKRRWRAARLQLHKTFGGINPLEDE